MKVVVHRARNGDSSTRAWLLTAAAACVMAAIVASIAFWPQSNSARAFGVGAVSAGGFHTCAIGPGLGVKCWGNNNSGQLGDGTTTNSSTPVDVSGLSSGVAAVSVGFASTCALTTAGGVMCWGYNVYGQLGNGTTVDSATPVSVSGLASGVAAISASGYHTCALTTAGGVKCWGFNGNGQLGDGTTTASSTPVNVSGLSSGVAAVSAGFGHTCALTTSGGVKCWGGNGTGALGDGTTTDSYTPVNVSGLSSGVAAISSSSGGVGHTCALTTAGGVKCWGYNFYGQLGDGTNTGPQLCTGNPCSTTPVDVSGLASGVAAVSAGSFHTCAVTTAGGAKCWGFNSSGQLGDGTTTDSSVPVNVLGLASGVQAVSAGYDYTCALTTMANIKCWGRNDVGQLGDGTTSDSSVPVPVFASVKDNPPVPPCPTPYAGGCVTQSVTASLMISVPAISSLPLSCNVSGVESLGLGPVMDFNANLRDDQQIDLNSFSGYIDCPGPIGTGSSIPSKGRIEEVGNKNPGVLEFPASGMITICLRVQTTLLGMLQNCPDSLPTPMKDPLVLSCTFGAIDTATCTVTGTSKFLDSTGAVAATVLEGTVLLAPPVGPVTITPTITGTATTPTNTRTPTPTRTPGPVGGVSLDPASPGGSANDALLYLALAGGGVIALTAAGSALYARRRQRRG